MDAKNEAVSGAMVCFMVIFVIFVCLCVVSGFIMSFVGNAIVLFVMLVNREWRRRSSNYYIIALAVTDLLSGGFCIPITIIKKATMENNENSITDSNNSTNTFGSDENIHDGCIKVLSMILCLFIMQISLQCCYSRERYLKICRWRNYLPGQRYPRHQKRNIFFCFLFAVFVAALPLFKFGFDKGFQHCGYFSVAYGRDYQLILAVVNIAVILTILILNCMIFKTIRKPVDKKLERQPSERVRLAREKAAQKFFYVIVSIVFSWVPLAANFLLVSITGNPFVIESPNETFGIALSLLGFVAATLNSAFNPILYAFRLEGFHAVYQKTCPWCPSCSKQNHQSREEPERNSRRSGEKLQQRNKLDRDESIELAELN